MDPRVEKLADVLVNYSVKVQPGELVRVRLVNPLAEPLGLAVYKHILKAGGHPYFQMEPTGMDVVRYRYASDEQLDWLNPIYRWAQENVDVDINILVPANTRALSTVDPHKLALTRRARLPMVKTFMDRQARGELRWTLAQFPTQASAQDAEMSLSEYEDFLYRACGVHLDDPVAYWQAKAAEQQRLVDWLKGKDRVEVRGENVDLTLSIKERTFVNAQGDQNMPDGEIFTGPVEDSVNGWVRFTYPAIYDSREVENVQLWFEDGRVVKAAAGKGQAFLDSVLETDPGARYVGEFAIGTNEGLQRFTRDIFFDEKIGGTMHLALGAGYPETGSRNESSLHWDMICDMRSGGEITVDGKLFYKDGMFQV